MTYKIDIKWTILSNIFTNFALSLYPSRNKEKDKILLSQTYLWKPQQEPTFQASEHPVFKQ
jgi:hypothetical protein